MDNLTHSLVGLVAAKAGLEKLSPGATTLCLLATNAPDSDIIALLGGRWTYLQYHRGITHSILGTLTLALILPIVFYLLARLVAKIRSRPPLIRLRGLVAVSLVVSATHPFLDLTNNYGVRLLLPWSSQWFYGDLVFIVDPFLWLVLGGAGFLLTSASKKQIAFWFLIALVLTYLVISVPSQRHFDEAFILRAVWIGALISFLVLFKMDAARRWRNKIGLAAFALLLVYWGGLAILHSSALKAARVAAAAIAHQSGETITDVAAMPTLANPFVWMCVAETERAAYRFEVSLIGRQNAQPPLRQERADTSAQPAVARALEDSRAKIFLGFARFPVVRVEGDVNCVTEALVQLADLRYTQPGTQRGTFSLEVPVDCSNGNPETR